MDKLTLLKKIRDFESDFFFNIYSNCFIGKVLEIGSNDGSMIAKFKNLNIDITGIEINNQSNSVVENIIIYDGINIPFPNDTFDLIISSNVLEHINKIDNYEAEIYRVLKPKGNAIHVMPTHVWRILSMLVHYPLLPSKVLKHMVTVTKDKKQIGVTSSNYYSSKTFYELAQDFFLYPKHGERGNRISEIYYFTPYWWCKHFKKNGWKNLELTKLPIFYTDQLLFSSWGVKSRALLGRLISISVIYKMTK